MKNSVIRRAILFAALSLLLSFGNACATVKDDADTRPWNAPKGWESGLPGGMMQGR
jgi:hypothetical protein